MVRYRWFLALFLGFSVQALAAEALPELKVGVMDFPPFYEVVPNRPVRGVLLAPIDQLMHEAGLSYRLNGYPAKRLYRNLATGESDFFIGIKGVPEYEGKVYYSPAPINIIRLQLYRLPGTAELPSLGDVAGKSLIVIRGYSYGGLLLKLKALTPAVDLLEANDHKQALMMLKGARGSYLLDYSLAVDYTQLQLEKPLLMEAKVLSEMGLYLLVSKKTPHAEAVTQRLNEALARLLARGELDLLKHYNPKFPVTQRP